MRWSDDDQNRFSDDLTDFLDANRDADDLPERIIGFIEDTLVIAGVPFSDEATPHAVSTLMKRLDTPRWKRWVDRLGVSRSELLAGMLAAMVGALIDAEDRRERQMKRHRWKS